MTDIVKQLRWCDGNPMCLQAADEIERLRGLLREARTVGAMQIPDWLARIDAALRSTDQPSAALTNEAALKAQDNDPAAIYLGPACEADSGSYGDGRTWAEDQPWDDCECGHKPVRYVRADIHDAIAARLAALEESTVAANNSQLRLIDRLAEAQEQAKADRLVVDEAYRNERIAKARLVDKNILLAQAVEYGNDYKRERDDLMVNYQATLARLAEREAEIAKNGRHAMRVTVSQLEARLAEYENIIIPSWKREEEMWRQDEARLAEAIECCTIKDNRNLRLEAELAALKRAAWDVHEVIGDALDGDADMDDVCNAWNELGELLPAHRPTDSADEVQR